LRLDVHSFMEGTTDHSSAAGAMLGLPRKTKDRLLIFFAAVAFRQRTIGC
jgi:hypothetical protein